MNWHPFKPLVDWNYLAARDENGTTNLTKLACYKATNYLVDKIRMRREPTGLLEAGYSIATEWLNSKVEAALQVNWKNAIPGIMALFGYTHGATLNADLYTVRVFSARENRWKEIPIYFRTQPTQGSKLINNPPTIVNPANAPPHISPNAPTQTEFENGIRHVLQHNQSPINQQIGSLFNPEFVASNAADYAWNEDFQKFDEHALPQRWATKEQTMYQRERGERFLDTDITVTGLPAGAPATYRIRGYHMPTAGQKFGYHFWKTIEYWLFDSTFNAIQVKPEQRGFLQKFLRGERKSFFKIFSPFDRNGDRTDALYGFDV
ncbi:MAG: hypothetical protein HY512_01125 [Candidatus Aenigmarchaeota archaeon]|nr:hypothetical protein [Candidatus Aenigmarchaeota archaeon]